MKNRESLSVVDMLGLSARLLDLKKELFNLRFQKVLGELKNTSRFSVVKKDIARIKTEITKRLNSGVK